MMPAISSASNSPPVPQTITTSSGSQREMLDMVPLGVRRTRPDGSRHQSTPPHRSHRLSLYVPDHTAHTEGAQRASDVPRLCREARTVHDLPRVETHGGAQYNSTCLLLPYNAMPFSALFPRPRSADGDPSISEWRPDPRCQHDANALTLRRRHPKLCSLGPDKGGEHGPHAEPPMLAVYMLKQLKLP